MEENNILFEKKKNFSFFLEENYHAPCYYDKIIPVYNVLFTDEQEYSY